MNQGLPVANSVVLNWEINAFRSAIHFPETAVESVAQEDAALPQLLGRFRHSRQAALLGPRSSHPASVCALRNRLPAGERDCLVKGNVSLLYLWLLRFFSLGIILGSASASQPSTEEKGE